MSSKSTSHLLSPGRIGSMQLQNRIVVTGMGVSLAEPDGVCGERICAYHEAQARGGVSLIITGATGVAWPVGAVQEGQIAISDDRFIPGLSALAAAVHAHGAKLAVQLHHGGLASIPDMVAGRPLHTPSLQEAARADFTRYFLPDELATMPSSHIRTQIGYRVLTHDDIRAVVEQFAAAADRAQRAGIDCVEIHGGHGYLLSSFISPHSNKRTDAYGGTLENRARFLLEVIAAVRGEVGADYPILCKIDSREEGRQGITLEEAKRTAKMAEEAGADAITVTAYHSADQGILHSSTHTPHQPAINLPFAAAIKRVVTVPVIASGRIEPEIGDAAIADGSIDFVSMGRKLLADPGLPGKLAAGRANDIRPCVYCYTCISAIYLGEPARCAVNPEIGFEYLEKPLPTTAAKHVVVIGGGPAGMEAARRLDLAGHRVTLLDKSDRLGGTLRFASLAYEANERLLDWLKRQIETSDVKVRLSTAATPELLRTLQSDAVVVATGAVRGMPPIPGNDLPHVFSGDDMRQLMLGKSSDELKRKTSLATRLATWIGAATGATANLDLARKATHHWMPLGQRIVIIGGGLVGLELAEFLTERGRRVTVVDTLPRLGADLAVVRRMRLLDELAEHGVVLQPQASDIRIEPEAVRFVDHAGQAQAVAADHVIVAKGAAGNLSLAEQLGAAGFVVHTIGDCAGIGYIEGAMRGAAKAANEICGMAVQ